MNSAAPSSSVGGPVPGCDPAGEVFLREDRVLRGVGPEHADLMREMLRLCVRHDLFKAGVIPTREVPLDELPSLGYALVLEHERVPRITYPHEWPASMLREAALFLLGLARTLAPLGVALKDWHPYNILFRGVEPVYVDFASLIPAEALHCEPYLLPHTPPRFGRLLWDVDAVCVHEVYRRTFVPYCLLPLQMMDAGRHVEARRRLYETALNTTTAMIAEREVVGRNPLAVMRGRQREFRCQLALVERGPHKERFLARLAADITALDVAPPVGGYAGYYQAKGEDLPFEPAPSWPEKPRLVHEALRRLRPETLLDLGCNTGWYSILAARLGCSVTAVDIDEYCVDELWRTARRGRLDILPLVLDLSALPGARFPLDWGDAAGLREDRSRGPLYDEPERRLGADAVLALAIVHHLVLGRGWTLSQVVDTLAAFTHRTLLVEFVASEDPLVAAEPEFFPAWAREPARFDGYTLERFLAELGRRFATVTAHPLHPTTRTLVTCTR